MEILTLGILAHVDAGKTTLKIYLIDTPGHVDFVGGVLVVSAVEGVQLQTCRLARAICAEARSFPCTVFGH